ncbi:MAG: hypothetical protein R2825_15430 [Saprospiraceae bacterium]
MPKRKDGYPENEKEPLDEMLKMDQLIPGKSGPNFAELLSGARAVDHEVENQLLGAVIVLDDPHDKGAFVIERAYHQATAAFCADH